MPLLHHRTDISLSFISQDTSLDGKCFCIIYIFFYHFIFYLYIASCCRLLLSAAATSVTITCCRHMHDSVCELTLTVKDRVCPVSCLIKLTDAGQTVEGSTHSVSEKLFVLEPELHLNSYSANEVSIWIRLTGWNFAGKVRTSLKLRPMTTNCIQYAVWHITNNSSGALDGAPKESMNRPWLHSFYRGFWQEACSIWLLSSSQRLKASLLAGLCQSCRPLGSLFFYYQTLCDLKAVFRSIQMLNAGIFTVFLGQLNAGDKTLNHKQDSEKFVLVFFECGMCGWKTNSSVLERVFECFCFCERERRKKT